jgi:hypothetical protein
MKAYIRKQVQSKLETRRKEWEETQRKLIYHPQQQQQLPATPPVVNPTTIRLFNFTNNIHWADEEEKDEIISNIKEFLNSIYDNHQQIVLSNSSSSSSSCSSTSVVLPTTETTISSFLSNLSVWKLKNSFFSSTGLDQKINELLLLLSSSSSSSSSSFSSPSSSDSVIMGDDWIFSFVDIRFQYKELADLYVQFMNEMVISGETLTVIYSLEDNGETLTNFMQLKLEELTELVESQQREQEKEKEKEQQPPLQIEDNDQESDSPRVSSPGKKFVVLLQNIITEKEEVSDPDDVKETLNDIYSLCPEKQLPELLWIEKRPSSSSLGYSRSSGFPATITSPTILLTLLSLKESFLIYQLFHDKKINDYPFQVYYRNLFPPSNDISPAASSDSSLIDLNNNLGHKQRNHYFVLGIKHFISFEEYQDEDERQEIAENILSLLNSFPNKNSNDTFQFETIFFVKEGEEEDEEGNENETLVSIYFIFSSITFPLFIELFDHLKNQIISGNSLSLNILVIPSDDILQELLRLLTTDEERPFLLSSSSSLSRYCQLLLSSLSQEKEENEGRRGESIISMIIQSDFFRLDHWFSEEEEEQENSDCNHSVEVKIKEEFLSLVNDCLGEGNNLKSLKSLSFPNSSTTKEEQRQNFLNEYLISLQYSSYSIAISSLLHFDGLVLGGKRVNAFVEENTNKETKPMEEDEKGMKRSSNIIQYHNNHSQNKNQVNETAVLMAVVPLTLKTNKELPQFEFSFSSSNWQQYFDCAYFEFFFPSQSGNTPLPLLFLPQLSVKQSLKETKESLDDKNYSNNSESWEIQPEDLLKEEQSFLTAENQEEQLFDDNGNPLPPVVKPVGLQSIYPKVKTLPKAGFHQTPSHSNIPVITFIFFLSSLFSFF